MRAYLVAALLVLAGLAVMGGGLWSWSVKTERLQAQAQRANDRAAVAEAALARLQQHQAIGNQLTQRLATAEAALLRTQRERDHALAKHTTGRTCLDAGALRVLHGAPGIRVAGMPGTTGSPDAAGTGAATAAHDAGHSAENTAEPAAEEPAGPGLVMRLAGPGQLVRLATDHQVAGWALQAGALYETCRQRLQALIDFHHQTHAAAP
jgi:prophage endopeptidase